jgi:hypothetical protein
MQLSDLPHFTIKSVRGRPDNWLLEGQFDHLETVREGRSWLYISRNGSLIGDLDQLDRETRRARFTTPDSLPQDMLGVSLPWLDGWWQAYHLALILDRSHEWTSVVFAASDAIARSIPGWRELRPASDCDPEPGEVLVPGGWNHEHCMLCNVHIDPGITAYVDFERNWLCVRCYESYAKPHDVGFVRSDA